MTLGYLRFRNADCGFRILNARHVWYFNPQSKIRNYFCSNTPRRLALMPKPIYLDYNATTPHDPEVIAAMRPFFEEEFGNPSSSHYYGSKPRQAVIRARQQVASLLNCKPWKRGVRSLKFTQTEEQFKQIKEQVVNLSNSKIWPLFFHFSFIKKSLPARNKGRRVMTQKDNSWPQEGKSWRKGTNVTGVRR